MRAIDADKIEWYDDEQGFEIAYKVDIDALPTLTPPTEWVSVEDRLPQLPTNSDWCSIMVITTRKNDTKSRPMVYERAIVRGKRVERWKYYWDKIAHDLPDYWMPLPEPPDSRPSED